MLFRSLALLQAKKQIEKTFFLLKINFSRAVKLIQTDEVEEKEFHKIFRAENTIAMRTSVQLYAGLSTKF